MQHSNKFLASTHDCKKNNKQSLCASILSAYSHEKTRKQHFLILLISKQSHKEQIIWKFRYLEFEIWNFELQYWSDYLPLLPNHWLLPSQLQWKQYYFILAFLSPLQFSNVVWQHSFFRCYLHQPLTSSIFLYWCFHSLQYSPLYSHSFYFVCVPLWCIFAKQTGEKIFCNCAK